MHLSTGGIFAVLLCALAVSVTWFSFHHTYYANLGEKIKSFEQQRENLESDHKDLSDFQAASQQGVQIYQDFHRKHLNKPSGVEYLQEKIQKWQKQFKIQTLHTQVGTPILESEPHQLWRVSVAIDLSVLKDKVFFQFLDKIQWELPGLVTIKNMSVSRVSALTDDMVRELIRGNSKGINLFQGKIEFDWVYLAKKP